MMQAQLKDGTFCEYEILRSVQQLIGFASKLCKTEKENEIGKSAMNLLEMLIK